MKPKKIEMECCENCFYWKKNGRASGAHSLGHCMAPQGPTRRNSYYGPQFGCGRYVGKLPKIIKYLAEKLENE